MSLFFRRMIALLAVVGVGLVTAACRENEQGRVLIDKKGTYLGSEDEPLDPARSDELMLCVHQQRSP